jgi:hypothetical protein
VVALEADVFPERPMNGAEKRKVNRILARAVALELIRNGDWKQRALDMELMPTDRVMQRWAICVGDGLSDKWDDSRKSRLPALDDATAIIVDQVILRSPTRYQSLARQWYCGAGASVAIAERLGGLTRHGLYMLWRRSLLHFRARFLETGHADLVSLLERLD